MEGWIKIRKYESEIYIILEVLGRTRTRSVSFEKDLGGSAVV
jgi:hypothetical protein